MEVMGTQGSVATPLHCSTRVEQSGDELALRRRTGSAALGGILLLWLTGWTVGCVQLAGQALERPDLLSILVGVPFWSTWVLVACASLWMFFGTEQLRVAKGGLEYRRRAVVEFGRRRVPLEQFEGIAHESRVVHCESRGAEHGLRLDTAGKPLRFAFGVETQERLWLAEVLRQHLQALLPNRPIPVRADQTPGGYMSFETLKPQGPGPPPPWDSRVRLHRDGDRAAFTRGGTFSPAAVGFVTFLCLFWNGITGGLALNWIRHFAWDEFFFLLPFEVIGLGLVLAWWVVVLTPFWKQTWVVDSGGMSVQWSVLGRGRTRRVEDWQPGRVEMRRSGPTPPVEVTGQGAGSDRPFSLALVGHDGKDRLTIDGLTEGEARWIGGELCRSLPRSSTPPIGGPDPLYDRWLDA
jgi:hypothetical protein